MIIKYDGVMPVLGEGSAAAESSAVIGNVSVGKFCGIWFGAVLRGDCEAITVGDETNIQDNCVIHTSQGFPTTIGKGVTVGHGAVIHGCTVEDNVLIGMGATVLDGAYIESNCIIGAGALVSPGKRIPSGSLVVGVPGKPVRELSPQEVAGISENAVEYKELLKKYDF